MKGKTFWVLLLALLAGGGVLAWQAWQTWMTALPPGIASGNGRVESVQVDVTTKEPGRVATILVHEGDMVRPGQIVAKMDTVTLEAELAQDAGDRRRAGGQAVRGRRRDRQGRKPVEAGRGRVRTHQGPLCTERGPA